ncbi:hypothetical protein, partial [Methanothrix sp.]|uniref:hypothetical protein n=1 Tax=Methanothrix sp. TaxID=90426 RepID=UPI0034E1B097
TFSSLFLGIRLATAYLRRIFYINLLPDRSELRRVFARCSDVSGYINSGEGSLVSSAIFLDEPVLEHCDPLKLFAFTRLRRPPQLNEN